MSLRKELPASWLDAIGGEFNKAYFEQLERFVEEEYSAEEVFPKRENIFRAFALCPIERVRVVIIGQDPYHGVGQANGLCFSVDEGVDIPPSLRNIFKEVSSSGFGSPNPNGDLTHWAQQGVLLLNSVLTVRAHSAASHANRGWESFTDAAISAVCSHHCGVVYMLWGKYAAHKAAFVDQSQNLILRSPHPSPLSAHRGFFGSGHFLSANRYLSPPIAW